MFISCGSASIEEPKTLDIRDGVMNPKQYVILKTQLPIQIDGIQDKAWAEAPFSEKFVDISGSDEVLPFSTRFKMMWDTNYLYIYAYLEEPHIWADIKKRDEVIFYNNDFEVFIDTDPNNTNYVEIEMNALNTVWDLILTKPYRAQGQAIDSWNLEGLKTAVHIDGTINNDSDEDLGWAVEMAIPFTILLDLEDAKVKYPKEGDIWRMNFSRVEWQHDIVEGKYQRKKEGDKFLPEDNWVWSPQKVVNMHQPERWGLVQFSDKPISEIHFSDSQKEFLEEQILYSLYRMGLQKELPEQFANQIGEVTEFPVMFQNDENKNVESLKTLFGLQFAIKGTSSDSELKINEEGLIKKSKK